MPARINWTQEEVMRRVVISDSGCWVWQGGIGRDGYARQNYKRKTLNAHRFVYELLVGPLTTEVHLDHTCHNADLSCVGGWACGHRRCVNPDHLEPVTRKINMERAAARRLAVRDGKCKHGHEMSGWNVYIGPKGARECRACSREQTKSWEQRHNYQKPRSDPAPLALCLECGRETRSKKHICRECWRAVAA